MGNIVTPQQQPCAPCNNPPVFPQENGGTSPFTPTEETSPFMQTQRVATRATSQNNGQRFSPRESPFTQRPRKTKSVSFTPQPVRQTRTSRFTPRRDTRFAPFQSTTDFTLTRFSDNKVLMENTSGDRVVDLDEEGKFCINDKCAECHKCYIQMDRTGCFFIIDKGQRRKLRMNRRRALMRCDDAGKTWFNVEDETTEEIPPRHIDDIPHRYKEEDTKSILDGIFQKEMSEQQLEEEWKRRYDEKNEHGERSERRRRKRSHFQENRRKK